MLSMFSTLLCINDLLHILRRVSTEDSVERSTCLHVVVVNFRILKPSVFTHYLFLRMETLLYYMQIHHMQNKQNRIAIIACTESLNDPIDHSLALKL